MAIKVAGTTVINDSRNIENIGIASVGIATASSVQTQNLNVTGIATIVNLNVTSSNPTNLSVAGVSTLGTVKISSGVVTATSGVVTYYGDGSKLTGLPVGITSDGSVIGYGFTTINFVGTGNSIRSEGTTVHVKLSGGGSGSGSPGQSIVYSMLFG
jgi:hypothetical protein